MPSLALITSPADPLLTPWLELFETAFPPAQRFPSRRVFEILEECARGEGAPRPLLAALDDDAAFAGLAFYILPEEAGGRAAYLWYLAVLPELRGRGLGAWLYRGVLARLPRSVELLVLDVEIPELLDGDEERDLARRRIRFYRRLGLHLLNGVNYTYRLQPDLPSLTTYFMVHPLVDLAPAAAFALSRTFLPTSLTQTGPLQYG